MSAEPIYLVVNAGSKGAQENARNFSWHSFGGNSSG
jgi:hypothetical protein